MESSAITYGSRIKFYKEGHLMTSHKIFSNGIQMVRIVIDTERMIFKFVDPVTGITFKEFDKNIKNLEVLQRHIKKELKSYLGVKFTKEKRKVKENVSPE